MISKIFKAYDVRATYPEPLGADDAWKVGHATATFLRRSRSSIGDDQKVEKEDTIVVGRDMRPHSPELAGALIEGIRSTGMNVIDIGLIDTSCIYFAINHYGCVGGIQTTASHNPVDYNGFKISGPLAKPIGSQTGLKDIERIAGQLTRAGNTGVTGELTQKDIWPSYREHVLQFLDLKKPVKIAVDASNGMAGVMVPKVFGDISDLSMEKLLFETGVDFVHDPNPLVEQNLELLQNKVREGGYDAGVCFDGDADRCVFIDENGKTIGCDLLTAIIARDFLEMDENKGSVIVYDLRSSHALKEEIEKAGGKPKRDRVGHVFMKKTMADTSAVFGGELSGHFYFRDNFNADSGAIAFARMLSILSKTDQPLSQLVAPLDRFANTGEVNFRVEDKDGAIKKLGQKYQKHDIDYLDGITIDSGDAGGGGGGGGGGWWFNVRKSNTEPMLRLNLEAKDQATLDRMFDELKGILGEPAEGH